MNKVLLYFVLSILIVKVFNDDCSSKNGVENIEDSECRQLGITEGNPSEQYICIKNTDTPESTGCKEEKLCQYQGEKDDCSGYPTAIGYKCIRNEGNCEAEQIICGEEGAGKGSSDLCPLLKVDDEEHKACVKHETEERCIVATNCVDVKVDATDEICAKLSVDSGKKCLKEGVACVAKTICNEAAGASDDDCKDFWVSDSNSKKCAKKKGEELCEEVSKAEEEQPTPNTQATEAQPTQQQTPNPTPTPTSEASQNTQATQNTQTTQNSQTTSSDTTSSTTQATKSSNLSSADGIKMSLMILIIMFIL